MMRGRDKKDLPDEPASVLAHVQDNIRGANSSSAAQSFSEGGQCSAHNNPDDEVLRRFEALRRLRKAAGQAAEIARNDAEELTRLQAVSGITLPEPTPPHQNQTKDAPPPNPLIRMVPADYDVNTHNIPVLKARADRVLDLGNFWSQQQQLTSVIEEGPAHMNIIHDAAQKAGSYQELARVLKTRLQTKN